MLWYAQLPERRALGRLEHTAENVSGAAHCRLRRTNLPNGELPFGVEGGELLAYAQAAARNRANAPPVAVHQLEHARDEILGRLIAVPAHGARVLVLDVVTPCFELAHGQQHAFENVERLESGDDDRHAILRGDRLILGPP